MKRVLPIFFLLACIYTKSYSQYAKGQMKEDFYWAETFILYEEYKEALPLYQGLLKIDPKNTNYRYRIGQCLINIEGRKQEAVTYLEAATKNIDPKYKEGKFKETGAPYDAYYYLANAYRINNQLDKALSTYEKFKRNLDPKVYDTAVVNQQIESCNNARELMKVPLYVKKINLGAVINSQYSELNPVISGDQTIMVYNRMTPFQEALLYTRKVNGKWTEPRNIIPDLGLGQESGNYATSLSQDGRELYIYRRGEDFDGNIYVTKRISDDKWSNLVKLNDNINSKYWESHATVSHDGKKLYFTSNRKDSYGGLDIYVSERDSGDAWKPAKNLGPVINTPYNEESPFLGKDDKTLFFSSRGHFNIGGYDIFYSTLLDNGQWSVPLNLGYPINTTDEDLFFDPVNDGYQAYYALIDSGGYGGSDIYKIEIFSKDHPRKFFVRGIVQVKDLLSIFSDSVKVSALNLEDPNAKVVVYSNPATGEYKFELPQGRYSITFEAKGAELLSKNFELPLTNPSDSFVLPGTTLPKTDFTADLDVGNQKNFYVVKGDTILLPLKVEKNSILTVEHWLGDSLLHTDKFIIRDTSFIYKTVPRDGVNRLVFKLIDRFSNTTSSEIIITKRKAIIEQTIVRPEYNRVIARKQINAFVELLKKRSDDNLKSVIQKSDVSRQQFGRVDDIVSYIKEQALKHNIQPADVDKAAIKVGVMDNVLTQAATDLLSANADCGLKDILRNLNIYDSGLKTWTDLQKYVSEKSNGKITPEELNRITSDVIAGLDPSLNKVRKKILTYSNSYIKGNLLKEAVTSTDSRNLSRSADWLKEIYGESVRRSITETDLAGMLTALSSLPGTAPDKYLEELTSYADTGFGAYLRNLDLHKYRLKSSYDIVLYLLKNRTSGKFTDQALFNAFARLITCKDIPEDLIKPQPVPTSKPDLLVLWIILGAGIIFFVFILFRRKKKEKKENE
jgi:tetratricopeptide (TPR) repeat protein